LAGWFASGGAPVLAGRVFFVWLSVYNLFVVSVFWSALADRFSAEQGKRLFAFIAAGGSMGALAGPALAASLVVPTGPAPIALLSALMLELTVRCYRRLPVGQAAAGRGEALGGDAFNGLRLLFSNRYLAGVALYFLLHTLSSTFLYLEQARIIAASSADTGQRAQWFALVDLAVSCASLLLQLFVTSRLLKTLGLAAGLALLPLAGWLAFLACALWPGLPMLAAAQAMRRACDYAISRPSREVLFTVTSREAKYKAKSAIETVVYRGGDTASGWLFAAAASAGIGLWGLAWIMLPVSLCWAGLSVWLARWQARGQEAS
jgi:AAA family ATP:ADP antiporter